MNKRYIPNTMSTENEIFQAGTHPFKIIDHYEASCHATDFPRVRFKDPSFQGVTVSAVDNVIQQAYEDTSILHRRRKLGLS